MVSSLLFLYSILVSVTGEDFIVQSPSGPIKGLKSSVTDLDEPVFKFLQIPYAKPPVEHLRFRKPEPMDPWTEVFDASNKGARICMQLVHPILAPYYPEGFTVSEDCLLLDIYVPKTLSPQNKKPVMVWIHGGAFQFGAVQECSDFAVRGDVIVVSIQYRLNIFGFFGLNNKDMKGNYGLWDQIMALKWINANIASFGGDPNRVTIFGESAGGISVHLLSLIPLNEGLFQRAIAQSGTSGFGSIADKIPGELIETVSGKTNCPLTSDSEAFVECLRAIPAEELEQKFGFWIPSRAPFAPYLPYKPVVDGELFKEMPHKLLKNPNSDVSQFYRSIDFMTGVNSHDGSGIYMMFPPEAQESLNFNMSEGIPVSVFCEHIAVQYADVYFDGNEGVVKAVCEHYTVPDADVKRQSMRIVDFLTESFFKVHAIHAMNAHAADNAHRQTYLYQFSRPAAIPFGPPPPKWYKGCGHADDVLIMFKSDFLKKNVKQKDMDFSNTIIAYWTNYAKTGNPNGAGTSVNWPTYRMETKHYIDLKDVSIVKQHMCPDAFKFWTEKIPAIMSSTKDEL